MQQQSPATTGTPSAPPDPQRIMQMVWGFSAPLILEVAVRNKLFDAMDARPQTLQDLVTSTGLSQRGLRAILNALVGFGFLVRQRESYALTPESAAFLVTTKPSFQGGLFRHISQQLLPNWMELGQVVRTGKPACSVNEQGHGSAFFEQFVEDIFSMSYAAAKALAEHLSPALNPAAGAAVKVLDIAAGSGVWGIALAQKSKAVQVTAVDWAGVTPVTRRVAARFGVGEQIHTIDGDLMQADFGTGNHIATLGHILHSEGEERSRQLLKRVFDALTPGGTVAIAEFLPNEDRSGPPAPLIFAVNMLVHTDVGDAFTFSEISGWLRDSGFVNPRLLDAPSVSPLILANRPGS